LRFRLNPADPPPTRFTSAPCSNDTTGRGACSAAPRALTPDRQLLEPKSENEDAELTPEEKNFLDYLVKQALRAVLDNDAAPESDATIHKDET
jgi:hypothetical protein